MGVLRGCCGGLEEVVVGFLRGCYGGLVKL